LVGVDESGEFAIERTPPSWCEPRYRTELLRGVIKLDECLVDIVPAPTIWRVVTLDDRVCARLKMLGACLPGDWSHNRRGHMNGRYADVPTNSRSSGIPRTLARSA